jgi:hypothetical protein
MSTREANGAGLDPAGATAALRIIRGDPSPEEIAAVMVILTAVARSATDHASSAPRAGGWIDPSLRLRRQVPPGPGAWRLSVWQ